MKGHSLSVWKQTKEIDEGGADEAQNVLANGLGFVKKQEQRER